MGKTIFFSSDLDDERLASTFGRLGKGGARLTSLLIRDNQYIPYDVGKVKLWKEGKIMSNRAEGSSMRGGGL